MKHLIPVLNILMYLVYAFEVLCKFDKTQYTNTHTHMHVSSANSHTVNEAVRWIGYYIDENQNKLLSAASLHDGQKSRGCNKSNLKSLYCDMDQDSSLWNFKKNECSTKRSAMWGYSSAQRPRVRLQRSLKDYKAVHLLLFFICGSWLERSSEFVHYIFFFHCWLKQQKTFTQRLPFPSGVFWTAEEFC